MTIVLVLVLVLVLVVITMVLNNPNFVSDYKLGLCQRYTRTIHGHNDNSSPEIDNHYLCVYLFEYFTPDDLQFALNVAEKSHNEYKRRPTYEKKMKRITIEIINTETLEPGDETVAIYKTFWLRIFQRKVRKWLNLKKATNDIIDKRQIHKMLLYRECSIYNLKNHILKMQ